MDQEKIEKIICNGIGRSGLEDEQAVIYKCLRTVAKIPDVTKKLERLVQKMDRLRAKYPDNQLKRRYYLGMQDGLYDAIDLIKEKLCGGGRK